MGFIYGFYNVFSAIFNHRGNCCSGKLRHKKRRNILDVLFFLSFINEEHLISKYDKSLRRNGKKQLCLAILHLYVNQLCYLLFVFIGQTNRVVFKNILKSLSNYFNVLDVK